MANITKVPNGPLIKKKGPFKGSTLKSGGTVKKAQDGNTLSPYMQKRAAQDLVKQKNIRARDSILNRNAAAKGMTREQVQAQQVADKNKPDAPTCDTNDPNFKSTKCGISKSAAKESKSDWKKKRNGGPVKKAQSGTYEPMNANTKIKTRSADGNYKLKIKGDKVVERRTLKGFFSGAPRAAGRMKEVPTGLVDKLTKKETESPSKSTVRKPIAKPESIKNKGREVAMNAARSLASPISQLPVQRKSTDTTAVKTKSVMKKGGRVVKKAQKGGTYYASSKGRVGRLSGSFIGDNVVSTENESMDTTGYSKGKKEFIKTKKRTFEKPSSVRVKREDVPKVISNLKKESTQKMDLRTPNQKKKSKMKTGGMIKRADGSMSRRGLWDNLRNKAAQNKKTGAKPKAPTKAMLTQEKKIKSKGK